MKLFATASNAASAHNFSLLKPVKPCYGNQNGYQPIYPHLSTHKMLITFQFIHKISPIFFLEFFYYPLQFFQIVDVLWTILHFSPVVFPIFTSSTTFSHPHPHPFTTIHSSSDFFSGCAYFST